MLSSGPRERRRGGQESTAPPEDQALAPTQSEREKEIREVLEEAKEELDQLGTALNGRRGSVASAGGEGSILPRTRSYNPRANLTILASSARAMPIQMFLTEETRIGVEKQEGETSDT